MNILLTPAQIYYNISIRARTEMFHTGEHLRSKNLADCSNFIVIEIICSSVYTRWINEKVIFFDMYVQY